MARRKRYTNYLSILFSIIIIGVFIYSEISESFKKEEYVPVSTDLIVEFIDVGQADSIYITNNNMRKRYKYDNTSNICIYINIYV